jgi:hypothetical protein
MLISDSFVEYCLLVLYSDTVDMSNYDVLTSTDGTSETRDREMFCEKI